MLQSPLGGTVSRLDGGSHRPHTRSWRFLMSRRVRDIFAMAALAVFAGFALLQAQSFTGAIIGTITDPTGAAVPAAKLKAIEESSNLVTETGSDVRGGYFFP